MHRASSIKVAEAAKVIENTQRDLNIALMNELSLIFHRIGIDTIEVLEAAGTKWNFLPFRPGLVGGHCIGVDPYYLTHKAEMLGYHPQVILAGRRINDGMGKYIAEQTVKRMIQAGFAVKGGERHRARPDFQGKLPRPAQLQASSTSSASCRATASSVHVHDPVADPTEARARIRRRARRRGTSCRAPSAIVAAVAHERVRRAAARAGAAPSCAPGGVYVDVKCTADAAALRDARRRRSGGCDAAVPPRRPLARRAAARHSRDAGW